MQRLKTGKQLAFSPLTLDVSGSGVDLLLQEAGGHRIQRIPPNEKRGRVHTSSVTVAVYDASGQGSSAQIPEQDIRIEWFSGTGAGGQHRNKCQNSCRVIHRPTGIVESRQGRSREANKRDALNALAQRLQNNANSAHVEKVNQIRQTQIGNGFRGEKIRTYRQRDNRVIDHISGKKASYDRVLKGGIDLLWE